MADMPENLRWMSSQDGSDKFEADMKIVADLIKQAMIIVEKYGARLKCSVVNGYE